MTKKTAPRAANRHAALHAALVRIIVALASKYKVEIPGGFYKEIGDDAGEFWSLIETYGSESWAIGQADGIVRGLAAAQQLIREQAAAAFVNGDDDRAQRLRRQANEMGAQVAAAEQAAAKAREERND